MKKILIVASMIAIMFTFCNCTEVIVKKTDGTIEKKKIIKPEILNSIDKTINSENTKATTALISSINPLIGMGITALIGALGNGTRITRKFNTKLMHSKNNLDRVKLGANAASEIIEEYVKGTENWTEAKKALKNAKKQGAIGVDEVNSAINS